MTTFKRIQTTDLAYLYAMENCGKNVSAGNIGAMVLNGSSGLTKLTRVTNDMINISFAGDVSTYLYKGAVITPDVLIGAWAIVRSITKGYVIAQIIGNNNWPNPGSEFASITLKDVDMLSATVGFHNAALEVYIVERPAFGRQSKVGTNYGPFISDSISAGVIQVGYTLTDSAYVGKYVQFIEGPLRGNCYKIASNTVSEIMLAATTDIPLIALTYENYHPSDGWFVIMDMVSIKTATSNFNLQLKTKVEGSNSMRGIDHTGGAVPVYEGAFTTSDKTRKFSYAAGGGEFTDSTYNPHLVPIDPKNYNGGAVETSGQRFIEDGFHVRKTPNRVPSGLTNGVDGWQFVNSPVPDTTHILFKLGVFTDRINNKIDTMVMRDCTLEVADYGYNFENDVKHLESKFIIRCNLDEVF